MSIQDKILTHLSLYGKKDKYKLARALKIDVAKIANVLHLLEEEGRIEIMSGLAILTKRKKHKKISKGKKIKPKEIETEEEKPAEEKTEKKEQEELEKEEAITEEEKIVE